MAIRDEPPFPFAFYFLPPIGSNNTIQTMFTPIKLQSRRATTLHATFRIPIPMGLHFRHPIRQRSHPTRPLTTSKRQGRLQANTNITVIRHGTISILTITTLPTCRTTNSSLLKQNCTMKKTIQPIFRQQRILVKSFTRTSLHFL